MCQCRVFPVNYLALPDFLTVIFIGNFCLCWILSYGVLWFVLWSYLRSDIELRCTVRSAALQVRLVNKIFQTEFVKYILVIIFLSNINRWWKAKWKFHQERLFFANLQVVNTNLSLQQTPESGCFLPSLDLFSYVVYMIQSIVFIR